VLARLDERPGEDGAEAGQDLLVTGPGDEDDPAAWRIRFLGDLGQSL
jgi:hypothetical protein